MESSSLLTDLLRLIGFSAVLAGVLIAFVVHRRNRSAGEREEAQAAVAAAKPDYRDTPTVRIMDSQHFDRLRRTARLGLGEQIDILPAHPIVGPRFRVSLKQIAMLDATPAAHLEIVYSGVQVSCGPLAKELGYNEFLVPRASREESRTAIFHYEESDDSLELMRVKVNSIDQDARAVELEVLQMRGSWPRPEA